MVRTSVKTVSYSSGSRRYTASRRAVAKAAYLLRRRVGVSTRAPLRTGGFYGIYTRRGREELKVCDVSGANISAAAVGSITLLNPIAQGSDYTNRVGRKYMLKSQLFRFSIFPNSANSNILGNVVRVIVFADLQTNSAAPAVADVLSAVDYLSPINLTNRDRFKVLCDKFLMMEANYYPGFVLTAGSPSAHMVKYFKKMNMEVINSGTGATVGAIQTGGVFILVIAKADGPLYDFNSRLRFTDS